MIAAIYPNGTIDLTGLTFRQAKLIQTAIRRLMHIEQKRNPLETRENDHLLFVVDDACNHFGKLLTAGKIKV